MKYFIGAKDKNGKAFIADMIEAENFDAAHSWLEQKAKEEKGEGNYRITACNEMPADLTNLFVVDEATPAEQKPRPRWSMLRIVDLPNAKGDDQDDFEVDLQIAHSTKFESAEEAKKSPAARLASIAFRFIDAALNGKITQETRVLDFYRAGGPPLIVTPPESE